MHHHSPRRPAAPSRHIAGTGPGPGTDDTLDRHEQDELTALLAVPGEAEGGAARRRDRGPATTATGLRADPPTHQTNFTDLTGPHTRGSVHPAGRPGLLGPIADWSAARTAAGMFQLVPVRLARDLALIASWMNDPAVAAFWELAGGDEATAAHLRTQLEGDGRSIPCLGVLDGTPMSYWEIYRADLDPLARYCRVLPHDTGLHLLIGSAADRGRGVGTALLRAVADLVLDQLPGCRRVLAEPDLRNTPSVAAFLSAGFRYCAEADLPDKRVALMVRDRALRTVL